MKSRITAIFFALIILCLLGVVILAFSSATAVDCVARVKGGSGTVKDPLCIEVEGHAGLAPIIDSLLPFRAVPAIQLSYTGERFYIPGINKFFLGKQKLARTIYLAIIILFIIFGFWAALRIAGKRIVVVDSRK